MFATFETFKTGLFPADTKAKCRRVITGCLECRRRKKKCDEQKPVCTQCSRLCGSNGRCTWPQHSKSPVQEQFSQGQPQKVEKVSRRKREDRLMTNQFFDLRASSISFYLCLSDPPEQRQIFQALLSRFDHITKISWLHRRFSLLAQALPLTTVHFTTKNALMACGAILLANQDPKWTTVALKYHTRTLHLLRTTLLDSEDEANLRTILLLHIFEELRFESPWPTQIHLRGAHQLLSMARDYRPPTTLSQRLMLEAFTFHVAVSSTFSSGPSMFALENYVKTKLELVKQSSVSFEPMGSWDRETAFGVPYDLLDLVFRLSLLRRQVPLQGHGRAQAFDIRTQLQTWTPRVRRIITGSGDNSSEWPLEIQLTGRMYRLACMVLLKKILYPQLTTHDVEIRAILREALEIWSQLLDSNFRSPTSIWPLVILGCAALTENEMDVFKKPFEDLSLLGAGSARHILLLFKYSWGKHETSRERLDLDVLLRDDLLCHVLL